MNAVTGVGEPWYTSGVHMWNGAAEALKPRPGEHHREPDDEHRIVLQGPAPAPIWANDSSSVAPNTSAEPNSRIAEPNEPTIST